MGHTGFSAIAAQLLAGVRALASEELQQLDRQAQRATQTLAVVLGFGVVAALLLGFAWLALCGILLLWLLAQDFSASLALLAVLLLNLAGALGCVLALRQRARQLAFPGTRQGLGGAMLWLAWRTLRPQSAPPSTHTPPPP